MAQTFHCAIGRQLIEVWSTTETLAVQVRRFWATAFPNPDQPTCSSRPCICMRFFEQGTLPCPVNAQLLRQQENLQIWRTATGFYLRCGEAALALAMERSEAIGHVPPAFWARPFNQQREFFTFALFLLLRAHGLYALHANAVEYQGQGVLLAGPSGSGKTTLTLHLCAAGWYSVGDDALVVGETATGVAVYPLRRGFSCTTETLAYLPHFAPSPDAPVLDRQKRLLLPGDSRVAENGRPCLPKLLLLPTIVEQPVSRLTPISNSQALFALLALTVGMLLDRTLATDHLQTVRRLVTQTSAYQLALGRDGLEKPSAVIRLLEPLVAAAA